MKICSRCRRMLPFSEFHKHKRHADGYQTYCRECRSAYFQEWYYTNHDRERAKERERYRRNPKRYREATLKSNFGITHREYDFLLAAQGGVCAICKRPETVVHKSGRLKSLAVDHDHETGKVRGLLCYACNIRVGYFEKRGGADVLIDYLKPAMPSRLPEVA